jgi:uncharacterized protein YoxC
MVTEICLVVIAIGIIGLVAIAVKISSETRKSIDLLQADLQKLAVETHRLLSSLNEFVQGDLHNISQETALLVNKFNNITSSDSHSIFSRFNFFKQNNETIPMLIKWVGSGIHLIKTTKEFIKSHGKETQ